MTAENSGNQFLTFSDLFCPCNENKDLEVSDGFRPFPTLSEDVARLDATIKALALLIDGCPDKASQKALVMAAWEHGAIGPHIAETNISVKGLAGE